MDATPFFEINEHANEQHQYVVMASSLNSSYAVNRWTGLVYGVPSVKDFAKQPITLVVLATYFDQSGKEHIQSFTLTLVILLSTLYTKFSSESLSLSLEQLNFELPLSSLPVEFTKINSAFFYRSANHFEDFLLAVKSRTQLSN